MLDGHRREELKEGVTSPAKAQDLLQKYSLETLGESLLAYVTKARAALGPPLLKVCHCSAERFCCMLLVQSQYCSLQFGCMLLSVPSCAGIGK